MSPEGRLASRRRAMIARRVNGGANAEQSRALLAELEAAHAGDNLAAALVFQGFALEHAAQMFAHAPR